MDREQDGDGQQQAAQARGPAHRWRPGPEGSGRPQQPRRLPPRAREASRGGHRHPGAGPPVRQAGARPPRAANGQAPPPPPNFGSQPQPGSGSGPVPVLFGRLVLAAAPVALAAVVSLFLFLLLLKLLLKILLNLKLKLHFREIAPPAVPLSVAIWPRRERLLCYRLVQQNRARSRTARPQRSHSVHPPPPPRGKTGSHRPANSAVG